MATMREGRPFTTSLEDVERAEKAEESRRATDEDTRPKPEGLTENYEKVKAELDSISLELKSYRSTLDGLDETMKLLLENRRSEYDKQDYDLEQILALSDNYVRIEKLFVEMVANHDRLLDHGKTIAREVLALLDMKGMVNAPGSSERTPARDAAEENVRRAMERINSLGGKA